MNNIMEFKNKPLVVPSTWMTLLKRKTSSGGVSPLNTKSDRNVMRAAKSRAASKLKDKNFADRPSPISNGVVDAPAVQKSAAMHQVASAIPAGRPLRMRAVTMISPDGWETVIRVPIKAALRKRHTKSVTPTPSGPIVISGKPKKTWVDLKFLATPTSYAWHGVAGTGTALADYHGKRLIVTIPALSDMSAGSKGAFRGRLKMSPKNTYASVAAGHPVTPTPVQEPLRIARGATVLVNGKHVRGSQLYPVLPLPGVVVNDAKSKMPRVDRKHWRKLPVSFEPTKVHWRNDPAAVNSNKTSGNTSNVANSNWGPLRPGLTKISVGGNKISKSHTKLNRAARHRKVELHKSAKLIRRELALWITANATIAPLTALIDSGAISDAWYKAFMTAAGPAVSTLFERLARPNNVIDLLDTAFDDSPDPEGVIRAASNAAIKLSNKVYRAARTDTDIRAPPQLKRALKGTSSDDTSDSDTSEDE